MADPLYVQIAADLRSRIESGRLASNTRLTEPGLQAEFSRRPEFASKSVSRNTVRDAIDLLVLEDLVEKRPGRGTFVTERIAPLLTVLSGDQTGGESATYQLQVKRRRRKRTESIPRVEIHSATKVPDLQLAPSEQVISRHQQRWIDGKPSSLQTSYYPFSYITEAPRLATAEEIEEGAVKYILDKRSIKQVGWRDVLKVRPANAGEIDFFVLTVKSAPQVLEITRTAFDGDRKPIRVTVTVYATDRNHLAYTAGEVPDILDEPS